MSIKTVFNKVGHNLKKHSPAIFTGLGIVGLGATAYLAYKSRDKVEAVVEKIEEQRELGLEVNKVEVAKDLTEALYQPVVAGALSVTCIVLAQRIQNNRIKTLVGALAVEQARNIYFEKKYRKQHGDEAYRQFMVPTESVTHTELDKKGKEIQTVEQVKNDVDKTIGVWYEDSTEYASDDHQYNIQMIDSVNEKLQTKMFQRGTLILNEVLEELGFSRIKNGALLGWTTGDGFELTKDIVMAKDVDEYGNEVERKERIYVSWTRPRYVYEDVVFNGRYSI